MAELATDEFLARVKAKYPSPISTTASSQVDLEIENPWYIITAVAFSASNRPDAVPQVFKFTMARLEALSATKDDKLRLVLRLREALFKAGLISGYSRVRPSFLVVDYGQASQSDDWRIGNIFFSLTV